MAAIYGPHRTMVLIGRSESSEDKIGTGGLLHYLHPDNIKPLEPNRVIYGLLPTMALHGQVVRSEEVREIFVPFQYHRPDSIKQQR